MQDKMLFYILKANICHAFIYGENCFRKIRRRRCSRVTHSLEIHVTHLSDYS